MHNLSGYIDIISRCYLNLIQHLSDLDDIIINYIQPDKFQIGLFYNFPRHAGGLGSIPGPGMLYFRSKNLAINIYIYVLCISVSFG